MRIAYVEAASLMTRMGMSRLTVKKILSHTERDATAVYDRHSYERDGWQGRMMAT